MKLRAVITEPANVARYLRPLDEAAELSVSYALFARRGIDGAGAGGGPERS